MQRIIICAMFMCVAGCQDASQPAIAKDLPKALPKRIDAKKAIAIAEQFVRENGYTEFVPQDASKIDPESIEFFDDEKDWLKQRHNTLSPKALGYRNGGRNDPAGWIVGFALIEPMKNTDIGQAITMDEHGENVIVQHMGFSLSGLKPRPE